MKYVCENNRIRLINSFRDFGTVISISDSVVSIQKDVGGMSFLPLNMVSVFSYDEVQ